MSVLNFLLKNLQGCCLLFNYQGSFSLLSSQRQFIYIITFAIACQQLFYFSFSLSASIISVVRNSLSRISFLSTFVNKKFHLFFFAFPWALKHFPVLSHATAYIFKNASAFLLRGARHAIAWHTSTAHLCKSTLRFGRRKTIVHRTMCALPEAISAGGLTPTTASPIWYIMPVQNCQYYFYYLFYLHNLYNSFSHLNLKPLFFHKSEEVIKKRGHLCPLVGT